jgi:hypothetical protein
MSRYALIGRGPGHGLTTIPLHEADKSCFRKHSRLSRFAAMQQKW